jgi:LNS2-like protein (lipin/Ned1/Smp2)
MPGPPASGPRGGGREPVPLRSLVRLALIIAVEVFLLGGLLSLSAFYAATAKLAGIDLVALPGERIMLRAKVERDGPAFLDPDIRGVELRFGKGVFPPGSTETGPSAGEATLGVARSGADGIAELPVAAPSEPGDHLYWVTCKPPGALRLAEPAAPITVSVMAPQQPILITDIDGTISRTAIAPVLDDHPGQIPPLPGAAAILAAASQKYRVLYLTARSSYLTRRTRRWLEAHGFPGGAILQRDLWAEYRHLDFTEEEFKTRALAELKGRKGLPEIRWGIGNRVGDGEAYARNGIRAILIDPQEEVPAKYRDRIQAVTTWEEIGKIILP